MAILSKATYRFNLLTIKIPMAFYTELGKKHLKSHRKIKSPQIAKGATVPAQPIG